MWQEQRDRASQSAFIKPSHVSATVGSRGDLKMTYSKAQIGGFLVAVAVIAVVAVAGFGVPLGTLLIIGLVLCCPLMMLGMHGGGHDHGAGSSAGEASEARPIEGPRHDR
jgi:hypothetical protein